MSRFAVDAAAVGAASAAVTGSIATLGSEVDAMTRHLVDLQSSWQGTAASSFQGVVTSWRATQARVHEELTQINLALAAAGRTYEEAEGDAVRMFRV